MRPKQKFQTTCTQTSSHTWCDQVTQTLNHFPGLWINDLGHSCIANTAIFLTSNRPKKGESFENAHRWSASEDVRCLMSFSVPLICLWDCSCPQGPKNVFHTWRWLNVGWYFLLLIFSHYIFTIGIFLVGVFSSNFFSCVVYLHKCEQTRTQKWKEVATME